MAVSDGTYYVVVLHACTSLPVSLASSSHCALQFCSPVICSGILEPVPSAWRLRLARHTDLGAGEASAYATLGWVFQSMLIGYTIIVLSAGGGFAAVRDALWERSLFPFPACREPPLQLLPSDHFAGCALATQRHWLLVQRHMGATWVQQVLSHTAEF